MLKGALLLRVSLHSAVLKGAALSGVRISKCDFSSADFRHAKLEGAEIEESNMQGADFKYWSLRKANFKDVNMIDVDLQNSDASGAVFDAVEFVRAKLQRALLSGAPINNSNLQRASLEHVSGERRYCSGSKFSIAKFVNSWLNAAQFRHCDLQHVDFCACKMSDADLLDSVFGFAILVGACMLIASLSWASLTSVMLTRGQLAGSKCVQSVHSQSNLGNIIVNS